MYLRNLKSKLLKVAGGVLLLLFVLALIVLFVNRQDQPASEAALKLKRVVTGINPVEDRDNAYVYLFGLSSAEGSDPSLAGIAHVKWLRDFMAKAGPYEQPEYPGAKRDFTEKRDPELNQLIKICRDNNRACAEAMARDPLRLQAWTEHNAKLIENYERLLEFKQWRELWSSDPRLPLAQLSPAMEGQRQMLLKAWLMAGKGDASGCKDLLERDLKFWRMVLAESSALISKLVAASAIERHFAMGNIVMRQLPASTAMDAIPDSWREPISARERSMERALANEWEFSDNAIGLAAKTGDKRPSADDDISETLWAKLLGRFLLQRQATSNAYAVRMGGIVNLFDRDYKEIPSAAKALLASKEFVQKDLLELDVYNPAGQLLINMGDMDTFAKYGFRVANLEGMRRAALLASQLRSNGVKAENVAEALRESELRDPYDGNSFGWIPAESSIVFRQALAGKPDLKLMY